MIQCHSLALGGGDSFFISYTRNEGVEGGYALDEGLPVELHNFIYEKNASGTYKLDLSKIKVVLGPHNKSWWVSDGKLYKFQNLPPTIQEKIFGPDNAFGDISASKHPAFLTLGAEGNYFLRTEGGASSWNLKSYQKLRKLIDEARSAPSGLKRFKNIALHPYRYDCWMVQTAEGEVLSNNLPPHMDASLADIKTIVPDNVKQAAQKERLDKLEAERRAREFMEHLRAENERLERERQRQEEEEEARLAAEQLQRELEREARERALERAFAEMVARQAAEEERKAAEQARQRQALFDAYIQRAAAEQMARDRERERQEQAMFAQMMFEERMAQRQALEEYAAELEFREMMRQRAMAANMYSNNRRPPMPPPPPPLGYPPMGYPPGGGARRMRSFWH